MNTLTSRRNGISSGASESNPLVGGKGDREDLAASSTRPQDQATEDGLSNSGDNHQPGDRSTASDTSQPVPPEMPRMIGDFDDNANAFWSLHKKEAKHHDEARIQSLKDDMDGVLIFAGLFSAALVSFIIDKVHDLQVNPAQQMVYYQRQNVALLAQISNQVSHISPQVPSPSIPTPPYPDFTPNSSDVRINVFWFMSLVFSLSAALLATLVQQWVRDYMHVFQRYSNPLKSARLRQYLYEGAEGWYMPAVAESVPGLVHVSLFLFFVGLCNSLFALNVTIGITTVVLITVCALLYVFSTFTAIVNPQSPFQTPFSRAVWYLMQWVHPRSFSDRDGAPKIVSSHMSEGRAQLAMEENEQRQDRDVRAIRWLIDTSTEDDEMESFVMAMPGTFTSKRGVEVWSEVSKVKPYEDTNPRSNGPHLTARPRHSSPLPPRAYQPRNFLHPFARDPGANGTHYMTMVQSIPHAPNGPHTAMYDLCKRVRHLVDTCNNRSQFATDELWRRRSRGCVETVASLVFYADIELELFGDLGSLLSELGGFEKTRALSATRSDESFVTRWTYLSLLVVTRGISNHGTIQGNARSAIDCLSQFREDDSEQTNHSDTDENALENARRIDRCFETASQFLTRELYGAIRPGERGLDEVKKVLANHEANISKLQRITPAARQMEQIDSSLSEVNSVIRSVDHGLSVNLPGVSFDEFKETGLIQPTRFFNLSDDGRQGFTPQFIFLRQRLRLLCSYADTFRDILDEKTNGVHDKILGSLHALWDNANHGRSIVHQQHLMERQLWRLQDLRDGSGFGFSIELFFLVLPQLLFVASSRDTHSALYIRTFRDITSNWKQHKSSIGTQRVILNLVYDIAIPFRGIFSDRQYPEYITDELLELLRNMVEEPSGSHIGDALSDLGPFNAGNPFAKKAMDIISRARVPSS
ncbi:hypothetical protein EDB92DRAFT_1951685 [Lactarius akahatsu]|uniref:DUF6535 domain-containing protein n=1 Tax=Lactarius akahatsu TaxID=416441 RepID=A0AAD4L7F0_9AGAM|nr:hypothetical protein EDB92DRAFT_1951685 [Lactarius akahatsu]